jgi:uncharacterized protein YceH (UPF0502 family)
MNIQLNDIEVRVLGCLIEKELTTPEYYPLTLNSLTAACNQKSNRFPVMALNDTDVARALDHLRTKHLGREVYLAGSRVPKYEHKATEVWELTPQEVAVLCVLLLRGPQTPGELRGRTGRMFAFSSLDEVNETLQKLGNHAMGQFVTELPRQLGHKESRFTHLLSGEPVLESAPTAIPTEPAMLQVRAENERIAKLEEAVQVLQDQLGELRAKFEDFKSQFE